MTGKNKSPSRANYRGASHHQNGAARQPRTEYHENERHSDTGRSGDNSHNQGGGLSSSSDGVWYRKEQTQDAPPKGQSRGEYGNHQRGQGSGDYKPNNYQRQLNEEARYAKEDKKSCVQQGATNPGQQDSSGQQKSSHSEKTDKLDTLKCVLCRDYYNSENRLPRSLHCGHTVCTACLRHLLRKDRGCPYCDRPINEFEKAEEAVVNYTVRDLVEVRELAQSDVKTESKGAETMSCRPKSESSKPIVTVTSSEKPSGTKSAYNRGEEMEWSPSSEKSPHNSRCRSPSPEKSPHNSRCLETGILPTSHCATCLKWVCNKCGNIDHNQQKGCFLIPKKEALSQMSQAQLDGAKSTQETVENTLTELEMYKERLDAFSLTMQAAFEAIKIEKERVDTLREEGQKKKKELDSAMAAMASTTNLPDALAALQQVEGQCGVTKVWSTESASKTLDHGRVNHITKEILLSTVQMKIIAKGEDMAAVPVLVQHSIVGVILSSHMEVDGGRINVHALEKMDAFPKGSRALPLTSVMSCLDPSSTLTFLDIGWGGSFQGRVFIRLLGDTLRGRQFVTLCTGKVGPSFRQTKFHRVWWKGLPGEHIWGGDHDKGNGSGGTPVLQVSDKEKSSVVHGRCLPIRAGLVAGRYEKTDISSIFRIYTKDCKKGRDESTYLAKSPVEVKDEAAFGQVEYGQHILDSAVKHNNIQDVTILNCGIVIET